MPYIDRVKVNGVEHAVVDDRLAGRNLLPNSREMQLAGTASVATGTWRLAGTSNMSRSRVYIPDGPFGPCYGFQCSGTQTTTSDSSCYGIDGWPTVNGGYYVLSLYARNLEGEGMAGPYCGASGYGKALVGTNADGKWGTSDYQCIDLTSEWKQVWVSFRATASNGNLYIGAGGTDAKIQMCCVKIESGGVPSPWTESPDDFSPSVSETTLSL